MVAVVAHAALPGFARTNHRKQESSFGEELLVPKLTFPKRHKHTDVRAREPRTPPEVEKLRKGARSSGRHGKATPR
jgi:hypothetical protein